jgi:site-specific recombinase XerD
VGRRDYAVLLLLARLGLRAKEVAALSLEDVDWSEGILLIRGKAGREDRMPLLAEVGSALASYLRRRRKTSCRSVFLRHRAPHTPLECSAIIAIVRSACKRAQLPPVGAHRLRHSAATTMLRRGATLEEISQVLRHRHHATTAIYAKVDYCRLRELAQRWPGALA